MLVSRFKIYIHTFQGFEVIKRKQKLGFNLIFERAVLFIMRVSTQINPNIGKERVNYLNTNS